MTALARGAGPEGLGHEAGPEAVTGQCTGVKAHPGASPPYDLSHRFTSDTASSKRPVGRDGRERWGFGIAESWRGLLSADVFAEVPLPARTARMSPAWPPGPLSWPSQADLERRPAPSSGPVGPRSPRK
jgi:hypothetical protein